MTLVLARCLEDPQALLTELQAIWRDGNLAGLALPEERLALQEAVLGPREGHPAPGTGPDPGPALVLGSGGSSGGRRWCLQPLAHLQASAEACGTWLAAQGIAADRCLHLAALPLHHVSGLMPLVRTQRWGAELRWLPPELLRRSEQLPQACPLPAGRPVLLSLVPTQLQRLLESPAAVAWLADCAVIWVGGAALSDELADRARARGLPLAPCYGATETAAMVCALPPARFLAGAAGCGAPLADVELRLEGAEQAIALRSGRLSPGWFAGGRLHRFAGEDGWWRSGDAGGWIPPRGADSGGARPAAPPWEAAPGAQECSAATVGEGLSLRILGRLDDAIHSGGETVFPEQVRQRLLALLQAADLPVAELLLLGEPDPLWGERLVALVRWQACMDAGAPGAGETGSGASDQAALLERLADLAGTLPPPQRPRRWLTCPQLAPSSSGKWQRQRWRDWLEARGPAAGTTGGRINPGAAPRRPQPKPPASAGSDRAGNSDAARRP